MPQTKQAKRQTAIRLYREARLRHLEAIPHCPSTQVDVNQRKIKNLAKHIECTEAKLEIGA